jgi:hypothetical protein
MITWASVGEITLRIDSRRPWFTDKAMLNELSFGPNRVH